MSPLNNSFLCLSPHIPKDLILCAYGDGFVKCLSTPQISIVLPELQGAGIQGLAMPNQYWKQLSEREDHVYTFCSGSYEAARKDAVLM